MKDRGRQTKSGDWDSIHVLPCEWLKLSDLTYHHLQPPSRHLCSSATGSKRRTDPCTQENRESMWTYQVASTTAQFPPDFYSSLSAFHSWSEWLMMEHLSKALSLAEHGLKGCIMLYNYMFSSYFWQIAHFH